MGCIRVRMIHRVESFDEATEPLIVGFAKNVSAFQNDEFGGFVEADGTRGGDSEELAGVEILGFAASAIAENVGSRLVVMVARGTFQCVLLLLSREDFDGGAAG